MLSHSVFGHAHAYVQVHHDESTQRILPPLTKGPELASRGFTSARHTALYSTRCVSIFGNSPPKEYSEFGDFAGLDKRRGIDFAMRDTFVKSWN